MGEQACQERAYENFLSVPGSVEIIRASLQNGLRTVSRTGFRRVPLDHWVPPLRADIGSASQIGLVAAS
jgi:hypothetical protein